MQSIKLAAAVAVFTLLSPTSHAGDDQRFSALGGVEAQALSVPEMNGIYGQLSLQELKDRVAARVVNPRLEKFLLAEIDRLAAAFPNRMERILAFLTSHGI